MKSALISVLTRRTFALAVVNSNRITQATQVEQLISNLRKYSTVHSAPQRAAIVHLLNLIGSDAASHVTNPLAGLLTPSLVDNQLLRRQANAEDSSRELSVVHPQRVDEINSYRPANLIGVAPALGDMVLLDVRVLFSILSRFLSGFLTQMAIFSARDNLLLSVLSAKVHHRFCPKRLF